jgi:hypothetical protein
MRDSAVLTIAVNGVETKAEIRSGASLKIRTPLPSGTADFCVQYTGSRELVILESAFE